MMSVNDIRSEITQYWVIGQQAGHVRRYCAHAEFDQSDDQSDDVFHLGIFGSTLISGINEHFRHQYSPAALSPAPRSPSRPGFNVSVGRGTLGSESEDWRVRAARPDTCRRVDVGNRKRPVSESAI
jgi:hypothetical protein